MQAPKIEHTSNWLRAPLQNTIDGELVTPRGTGSTRVIDPATGDILTTTGTSSAVDIDRAVAAAKVASRSKAWASRSARAAALRAIAGLIREHRAELATLETRSCGKLYRESYHDDIAGAADVLDYYAGWTNKLYGETCPVEGPGLNYTMREPYGVCALIVPWNWPLLMAAYKLGPALATGNTVILKPAENTPLTAVRLFEWIVARELLPPGVANLLLGAGDVGDALARHPGVDKVSFTGSTATGKSIVHASADSNLKPVTLELGGKSPDIVFDDVPDLEAAIERSAQMGFNHKGEKCSQSSRLYVQRTIYERFVAGLAARANARRLGNPFDPSSDQGPQASEAQMERILAYITGAKQQGARLVAGGERDVSGDNRRGFFVRPTVFADCHNQMTIVREEVFGPVQVVIPFEHEHEAVEMANDSPYGLGAGIWSRDISRAHRVANALDAGMVFVNHYGCYDVASPFGGIKQSGWGREMSFQALEAYTRLKSVWIRFE